MSVAAARFDTRVMGYQPALLLLARDSKRLWVIAVHEAIRAGELGLGRAIEAGLVLRRNGPKGSTRSMALETSIDGDLAEHSGHGRWFIRLTIRSMRTKMEHGLRINSLRSPSLRDTPGALMPATSAQ